MGIKLGLAGCRACAPRPWLVLRKKLTVNIRWEIIKTDASRANFRFFGYTGHVPCSVPSDQISAGQSSQLPGGRLHEPQARKQRRKLREHPKMP